MPRMHGIRERNHQPNQPVRRRFDWRLLGVKLFIVGVAVFVLGAIFAVIRSNHVGSICRDHGYPDERINWGGLGAAYCVKRVEQTDVVVPIGDL